MKYTSAKDLMTTDVKSVDADWPVERVAEFLVEHDISGTPVVKDGQLVGVVSLTDLAHHQSTAGEPPANRPASFYRAGLETQYAEEDLANLQIGEEPGTTAEDVMTPQVYDVSKHTSVQQVAQVMDRGRIHRVFVTENGEIQGVITSLDMLKVVAED